MRWIKRNRKDMDGGKRKIFRKEYFKKEEDFIVAKEVLFLICILIQREK